MLRPLPALFATALAAFAQEPVRTGIDVLVAEAGKPLAGARIGLITNHTGATHDGRRSIDALAALPALELKAIFSPEHGLQGQLDRDGIAHGKDEVTGLPVWSLYGETRQPTKTMLAGIDTLVFDIQDIGCRFYTYVSTMGLCLETAAEHGLRFVVLDRPNPIGGDRMAGPLLDQDKQTFVGWHTIPLRHGMTAGELMRMLVGERGLQVRADVVACTGWTRTMTFDRTGLPWIDPSPNMRSLDAALLYPGIGLLEGTNLSVGRGTDTPFLRIGAPWLDGKVLWQHVQAAKLPGLACVPIEFTPTASKHKGERCSGLQLSITDWQTFEPIATGMVIACALRDHFPAWQPDKLQWLLRSDRVFAAFQDSKDHRALQELWRQDLEIFRMRRKPFLLYP